MRTLTWAGGALELAWLLVYWFGRSVRIGEAGVPPAGRGITPLEHLALGGALLLGGLAYLAALALLSRGEAPRSGSGWGVLGFALLFQLTLLLMPGVFSADVFSYIAYGDMGGIYGLNPYTASPSALVGDPVLAYVFGPWRELPTVYGPLWTSLSSALAWHLQSLSVLQMVFAHKLLINSVHLVNLGLVWLLLGRLLPDPGPPGARVAAFAMFAWNPLVLLEIGGDSHNDALMLAFLLASFVPLAFAPRAGPPHNLRWLAWSSLVVVSGLVKYGTVPVWLVGLVAWGRQLGTWGRRLGWLAAAGLLAVGIAAAAYWPWFAGWKAMVPAVGRFDQRPYFSSLPIHLQRVAAERVTLATGLEPATAQSLVSGVVALAFVAYAGWELYRLARGTFPADPGALLRASLAASARILLAALLFVLPDARGWYFTWPLALVTLLGWNTPLARLVAGYTLMYLVADYLGAFDPRGSIPAPVRDILTLAYLSLPPLVLGLAQRRVSDLSERPFHPFRGPSVAQDTLGHGDTGQPELLTGAASGPRRYSVSGRSRSQAHGPDATPDRAASPGSNRSISIGGSE